MLFPHLYRLKVDPLSVYTALYEAIAFYNAVFILLRNLDIINKYYLENLAKSTMRQR